MRPSRSLAPLLLTLAACTRGATAGGPAPGTVASAVMHDAQGRTLGTLVLVDGAAGVVVSGQLSGLPPGEHAIHLHAIGKCEAPAFATAGGHWNPSSMHHGTQNPEGPHFGDLPTQTAMPDSSMLVQGTSPSGSLHGARGLLDADGASVVLHAAGDDNRTDPAGNSGARIACGVVQASQAPAQTPSQ